MDMLASFTQIELWTRAHLERGKLNRSNTRRRVMGAYAGMTGRIAGARWIIILSSFFFWPSSYAQLSASHEHEVAQTVYVCMGSYAYAFHSTSTCSGLRSCNGAINYTDSEYAQVTMGRKPCCICWSNVREDCTQDGTNKDAYIGRYETGTEVVARPSRMPVATFGNYSGTGGTWVHTPGYSTLFVIHDFKLSTWGLQFHKYLHRSSSKLGYLVELAYTGWGENDPMHFSTQAGLTYNIKGGNKGFSSITGLSIHNYTDFYIGYFSVESKNTTQAGFTIGGIYNFKKVALQLYYDTVRKSITYGFGIVL
jgi:hypothetical protein